MNSKARPIRSALYVPGNKEDWIRKAPQYGSDALILDRVVALNDRERLDPDAF